ncbi:phosphate ABC transporter permease subunit PstC [Sporolactobacillus terrae]|uniref:Phosphate transport system permease protein n=1 Tax=Sporolactobacillus terrae TaxID=269673 RepID=A0A5K7WYB1_9BACL|nr:phosphate ABC transporter permease subunit PstC [Sporolactobacillus terrae]BBN97598.1 phosphate transport system permease protein [Sporolactobacillus terrae]
MRKGMFKSQKGSHRIIFLGFSIIVVLLFLLFIGMLSTESSVSIAKFGLSFIISQNWNPVAGLFGALPFIYGTIVSSVIALFLGGTIGISTALFLTYYAPSWISKPLLLLVELLAAVPSVVYGLWGIFVLAPLFQSSVEPFLQHYFGFLPIFQGQFFGVGMLAAGSVLAIMILPIITSITRDVFATVPKKEQEAALGLGATKLEMIRLAVLPHSATGIFGGMMLALGRALGETMAVTMVIGNKPAISGSLFAPGYTMASVIANEFTEATTSLHISALFEIGLLLFVITMIFYYLSQLLLGKTTKNSGE